MAMNKTLAKKYLSAIRSSKKKHLTCEALGREMGLYSDVVREQLSFFEPLITMDMDYECRDLINQIDEYIESLDEKKVPNDRVVIRKDRLTEYSSIGDFVYKKFTIGGLVDRNITLSEVDLKVLKKLVNEELSKNAKPKKSKKR